MENIQDSIGFNWPLLIEAGNIGGHAAEVVNNDLNGDASQAIPDTKAAGEDDLPSDGIAVLNCIVMASSGLHCYVFCLVCNVIPSSGFQLYT